MLFTPSLLGFDWTIDIVPSAYRSASPYHGFTIMNRLSMENLVEPINKDLEFQLQDPFLLYRNSNCMYCLTVRVCGSSLIVHEGVIICVRLCQMLLFMYNDVQFK